MRLCIHTPIHPTGFAVSFPAGVKVSKNTPVNAYDALIHTSAVTLALGSAGYQGTNLRDATVPVSVGNEPAVMASCGSSKATNGETSEGTITLGGVPFAHFVANDAGAGSRWSWSIYRAIHKGACYEIVAQLAWTVIENYPAGAVKPFDRRDIENQLDAITRRFTFE